MGAKKAAVSSRARKRAWVGVAGMVGIMGITAVLIFTFLESRLPSYRYDRLPPRAVSGPLPVSSLNPGEHRLEWALHALPRSESVDLPEDGSIRMRSIHVRGPVQGLWFDSEADVDFGDIDSMLRDALQGASSDAERAEALWRFMMEGSVHGPRSFEAVQGGFDPLHHLTSYGYSRCGNSSSTLAYLWRRAGLPARTWSLSGHVAPEVFYDGAWHLFDADERLVFRDPHTGKVYGVEDLRRKPERIASALGPHGRAHRGHLPERLRAIYATEAAVDEAYRVKDSWLEPGDLRRLLAQPAYVLDLYRNLRLSRPPLQERAGIDLRAGEDLWLFWTGQAARFALPGPDSLFHKRGGETTDLLRPRSRRGNGALITRLAGTPASRLEGVRQDTEADRLAGEPGANGWAAVWTVRAPFVITNASIRGVRRGTLTGTDVAVRTPGGSWQAAGDLSGPEGDFTLDLAPLDATVRPQAVYEYDLRVRWRGTSDDPPELEGPVLQTDLQLNPAALPKLRPGSNRLRLRGEASAAEPASITFGWDELPSPLLVGPPQVSPPPTPCLEVDPDLVRAPLDGRLPVRTTSKNLEVRRWGAGEHIEAPLAYVTIQDPGRSAWLEMVVPVTPGLRTLWLSAAVEAQIPFQSARIEVRRAGDDRWHTVWEKGDTPYPEVFPADTVELPWPAGRPLRIRWVLESGDWPGPEIRFVRARVRGFCETPPSSAAPDDAHVEGG